MRRGVDVFGAEMRLERGERDVASVPDDVNEAGFGIEAMEQRQVMRVLGCLVAPPGVSHLHSKLAKYRVEDTPVRPSNTLPDCGVNIKREPVVLPTPREEALTGDGVDELSAIRLDGEIAERGHARRESDNELALRAERNLQMLTNKICENGRAGSRVPDDEYGTGVEVDDVMGAHETVCAFASAPAGGDSGGIARSGCLTRGPGRSGVLPEPPRQLAGPLTHDFVYQLARVPEGAPPDECQNEQDGYGSLNGKGQSIAGGNWCQREIGAPQYCDQRRGRDDRRFLWCQHVCPPEAG